DKWVRGRLHRDAPARRLLLADLQHRRFGHHDRNRAAPDRHRPASRSRRGSCEGDRAGVTRRSVLCVLALLAAVGPASAADSDSALVALERRYASVVSFTASFTQTYRAPGIETVESGVVAMKRPALMRWEYRRPEPKLFVADGKKTYLHR